MYESVIREYEGLWGKVRKCRQVGVEISDDEKVIAILGNLREMYWGEIHGESAEIAESEKRRIIKYILTEILPVLTAKVKKKQDTINRLSSKKQTALIIEEKERESKWQTAYVNLYRQYEALCAFRSYKHFCFYLEKVFGFHLWHETENCESGYFYYANKMMIDNEVNFIERQLPTGYGKTMGNAFMISYIFGLNIDSDVLYVCGNDKFTEDVITNVLKIMQSPEYAEIFPYYAQFKGDRDLMFSFCGVKALKFSITGSKKSTNLRIVTKLSDVNGVRAEYLFLDDITQRSDMSSKTAHDKDIHTFNHEWFERNYSRDKFKIIASGTTYSIFDILSYLKLKFNEENSIVSSVNKYTKIAYSNFITANKLACFVCVPLLDPDTDESTYPNKISTDNARKKREDNYEEYMAMDNQTPLPPQDNPFYFSQLREYESVPKVGECGRTEYCVASLDPKRSGKDFVAMPIFAKTNDGYYLIDFLYDQRPMKECYDSIVNKIIRHNINILYVERNTDEGISVLLNEYLKQRGFYNCKIEDIYNSLPKDKRIASEEADIKEGIIFPKFGMYSRGSQMGKALDYVYTYSYTRKNEHDDSIDALAMFAKRFINKTTKQYAQVTTFKR